MAEIFEVVMLICFGASWPMNVIKSWKVRTAKGKSLAFLCLILFGYIAGITGKFINPEFMAQINVKWYVLFVYFLNFVMVFFDFLLYFRNKRLDKLANSK